DRRRLPGARLHHRRSRTARAPDARHLRAARAGRAVRSADLRRHGPGGAGDTDRGHQPDLPCARAPALRPARADGTRRLPEDVRYRPQLAPLVPGGRRAGARRATDRGGMMRHWFALSAIGRDRPGMVADLAELIFECDCNLEDSSMTVLGSEFAVLL